jgi:hypothetical protein
MMHFVVPKRLIGSQPPARRAAVRLANRTACESHDWEAQNS